MASNGAQIVRPVVGGIKTQAIRLALAGLVPAGAKVRALASGWDSDAFEVGGLVIKQPKHPAAEARLRREAALLAEVRSQVTLPVPDLLLVEGPPVWSWHPILPGGQMLTQDYQALPEAAKARLAHDLAQFLAQVHRLDPARMRAAGAQDLLPWRGAAEVWDSVAPILPLDLLRAAAGVVAQYQALPPDPLGLVYGQFDGHGWNMAFDHGNAVLNGIYDFADSGIGPAHQDFIYAGLVSLDLLQHVARAYAGFTGHAVDDARVVVLAGMHRLWELAEYGQDSAARAAYLARFRDWADWVARL